MLFKSVCLLASIAVVSAGSASACGRKEATKAIECATELTSATKAFVSWIDSNYDKKNQDESKKICKKALNCFAELKKKCPDFPEDATETLNLLCHKVDFFTGPFSECMAKLTNVTETPTPGCLSKIFNKDEFNEEKKPCDSLKNIVVCEGDIGKLCGENMQKILHEENVEDSKRHKC
ncbi:unnamed protein product [Caenorhabditis bovis]|uniref:T20D4.11-like domain-containing protein n=1 Tax=Caenorhabditis bovis TaxID=2654633 RepID=A0A8S1EKN2_9PELO|nr:unnamed protein product [Caenorhabditis bovis]